MIDIARSEVGAFPPGSGNIRTGHRASRQLAELIPRNWRRLIDRPLTPFEAPPPNPARKPTRRSATGTRKTKQQDRAFFTEAIADVLDCSALD